MSFPDFADYGIVTIISEERDAILKHLGIPQTQHLREERVYYHGNVTDKRGQNNFVVVTESRHRGNNSAGAAALALMNRWKPRYILVVGIAGGVKGRDNL